MTEPRERPVMLRVLVGSQAHKTARPDSDSDFREVFYVPTKELLQVPPSARPKLAWHTPPTADVDDEAGWEVEQFLEMCVRGHPNSLELLWAPVVSSTPEGMEVRALAPSLVNANAVRDATLGYAKNCLNKLLSGGQPERANKWSSTYIRTLGASADLLSTGTLTVEVPTTGWGAVVRQALAETISVGEVIDIGRELERTMIKAAADGPFASKPRWDEINEWLMAFRERHWAD